MRKLGWVTVGFTYFLMVWGNLVSATGSGLACPDWPLCNGTPLPVLSGPVILEWGHRLLAFSATILILLTLYKVLKNPAHRDSALKSSGRSLAVLLGLQILLGGTTVLLGLSVAVSTVHLVVATLVFSGLITVASVITWGNPTVKNPSSIVRRLALWGLGGLMVQLIFGAMVRHGHAGLACPSFPHCMESFLPLPFTFETGIAFFHRWWGVGLLAIFFRLSWVAAKTCPELAHPTRRVFALSLAQVFLGIGTVMSGLQTHSRATHAAVGYLIWGLLFYVVLRSGGVRWLWARRSSTQERYSENTDLGLNPVG